MEMKDRLKYSFLLSRCSTHKVMTNLLHLLVLLAMVLRISATLAATVSATILVDGSRHFPLRQNSSKTSCPTSKAQWWQV